MNVTKRFRLSFKVEMPLGNQWRGNRTTSSHSTEGCPGNPQSSILLSRPMGTSGEANIRHEVERPLKFFKLQRTADFPVNYDETNSAVVLAHSAVEARQILQDFSVGDEVARFTSNRVDFWTREECATCVEFGVVTIGLYPGVVCLDFFNA